VASGSSKLENKPWVEVKSRNKKVPQKTKSTNPRRLTGTNSSIQQSDRQAANGSPDQGFDSRQTAA
jgi:hypothetical protein